MKAPTLRSDRGELLGHALLGDRSIVWGTAPVSAEAVLWDTNVTEHSILWGTDTFAGENILWIKNGVIPSNNLRENSVLWGTAPTGEYFDPLEHLF